jgi:hypothetical protein
MLLALALAAPPATLDEKIAAALKSHPDIKAAEAKKLLTEAELEQAKLSITQRVSAALSKIELAKATVMQAEEEVVIMEKVLKLGNTVSELEKARYMMARPVLIGAKAELSAAELELQLLIGSAVKADAKPTAEAKPDLAMKSLSSPVISKLENAVSLGWRMNVKDADLPTGLAALLKVSGLEGVSVRGAEKFGSAVHKSPPKVGTLSGDQMFAGWVQLMMDGFNADQDGLLDGQKGRYEVYVREYGLLVERADNAPKDAMTLTEFSRAVRARQK